MSAVGRVRTWHEEEGWGVLDCDETPGGCWFHVSAIESAEIGRGPAGSGYRSGLRLEVDGEVVTSDGGEAEAVVHALRTAHEGQEVELEWERADQDGFSYRAVSVRAG